MSYDDWKCDPEYEERMCRAFARRFARKIEHEIYKDVGDYEETYGPEEDDD